MSAADRIARVLRGVLPRGAVVVACPDLPYMREGPECMVGHGGRGLSVFVPRRGESEDTFVARLLAMRVMHPRWGCVAAAPGGRVPRSGLFDRVLDSAAPDLGARLLDALLHAEPPPVPHMLASAGALIGLSERSRKQEPEGTDLTVDAVRPLVPEGTLVLEADLTDRASAVDAWTRGVLATLRPMSGGVGPGPVERTGVPVPVVLVRRWDGEDAPRYAFSSFGILAVSYRSPEAVADALEMVRLYDPASLEEECPEGMVP